MKPILYHDIDGVLFGEYDGHFQLRPNAKGWLLWAHEHFQVVWLTTWTAEEISSLLSILLCEKFQAHLPRVPIRVAPWEKFPAKEVWLSSIAPKLDRAEWYWTDDNLPSEANLSQLGLEPDRCIAVDPKGADALDDLKVRLQQLLPVH
jgi:hypothetical protein